MPIGLLFRIAAVGIIVTLLCQVLKHSGSEVQSYLLTLGVLMIVLFWILPYVSQLFEMMETLFEL